MKLRDLIKELEQNGFYLIRQSGHMIFSNGSMSVAVPRAKMIKGKTAHLIFKHANLRKVA